MKKHEQTKVWRTWTWTREELILLLRATTDADIPSEAQFYVDARTKDVYVGHETVEVKP